MSGLVGTSHQGTGLRRWLLSGGAFVALALTGCERYPPIFQAIDLTGAEFGRGFAVQDPDGRTRSRPGHHRLTSIAQPSALEGSSR
jgi:hypothetical protein